MTGHPRRLRPTDVGWRLGRANEPRGGELWVPWDRTAGVIGPQGSGKTLDLLVPALLDAPGAAMATLTKVDDLLLTFGSWRRAESVTSATRSPRPPRQGEAAAVCSFTSLGQRQKPSWCFAVRMAPVIPALAIASIHWSTSSPTGSKSAGSSCPRPHSVSVMVFMRKWMNA